MINESTCPFIDTISICLYYSGWKSGPPLDAGRHTGNNGQNQMRRNDLCQWVPGPPPSCEAHWHRSYVDLETKQGSPSYVCQCESRDLVYQETLPLNGAHRSEVKANHVWGRATGSTAGHLTVSSQLAGEAGQKRLLVYYRNIIGKTLLWETCDSPKTMTIWRDYPSGF